MTVIIILAVLGLMIFILFVTYTKIYNRLVELKNAMESAWAQVDVQLKRRFDLIPNLVEVAKKYMAHEEEVLIGLTRARSGLSDVRDKGDVGKQLKAENGMGGALAKFQIAIEAYPDLKADGQMTQLMGELTATENGIAGVRSGYNNSVRLNNDGVQRFPANLVAGMFNFKTGEYFEVTSEVEREAVKVTF